MARRYRYKSYRQRKREQRNMVLLVLAAVVVVAGVFYMVKKRSAEARGLAGTVDDPVQGAAEQVMGGFERTIETPGGGGRRPAEAATEPGGSVTVGPGVSEGSPGPGGTIAGTAQPAGETLEPTGAGAETAVLDETTSPEAITLIEAAVADAQQGRIIAARDKFNEVLGLDLSPDIRGRVKENMAALAQQWLFSKEVLAGDTLTGWYEVKRGDYLANIAKQYKVPYELLMKINGLKDARNLRAGARIKVVHGPFHAKVYCSQFSMDVFLGNMYVKSYRIGLGKEGRDTPTGVWCVRPGGKLIKPNWTDPDTGHRYLADDPDYPLGSRWIALKGLEGQAGAKEQNGETGYAFHGTKDPESIGTRSSRGCIRLYNGDVIELYNLLVPTHSRVTVVN